LKTTGLSKRIDLYSIVAFFRQNGNIHRSVFNQVEVRTFDLVHCKRLKCCLTYTGYHVQSPLGYAQFLVTGFPIKTCFCSLPLLQINP